MWDFLKHIVKQLNAYSGAIGAIISLLGFFGVVWWIAKRINRQRRRVEVKAFEILDDPSCVLAKLLTSETDQRPVADHRIPYKQRIPGRDIQGEMKARLLDTHNLLIAAPTGYGKTREAAVLAQAMMAEGFHVIRVWPGVFLDEPPELLGVLHGVRTRILLILDDLSAHFRGAEQAQSPRGDGEPLLQELSYHDRLLKVLAAFDRVCGSNEVYILATARSEADQWASLGFDPKDRLWKRFGERFLLPEPAGEAITALLTDVAGRAGIETEPADLDAIAGENKGAFRNAVRNLQRMYESRETLNRENYVPTLDGSWRQSHEKVIRQYPPAGYIYDGIDLLRQVEVELYVPLVEGAARLVWGGNAIQRALRRFLIHRCLSNLLKQNVLRSSNDVIDPWDGQIEARCAFVEKRKYYAGLSSLALSYGKDHGNATTIYRSLAYSLYNYREYRLAFDLIHAIPLGLRDTVDRSNLGVLLDDLDRKEEAEAEYRAAIQADPKYAPARLNLGNLLVGLDRKEEAEAEYRAAIKVDPKYAPAHINLSMLLNEQDRKEEAEAEYRAAIQADPNDAMAYFHLGVLLEDLGRKAEAEAEYRAAIQANPKYAPAHFNLGNLRAGLDRKEEAEAEYRAAIQADPKYARAHVNLGVLLNERSRKEEAEAEYRAAIQAAPHLAQAHFGLGNLLVDLGRKAEAEVEYRAAIQVDPKYAPAHFNLSMLLNEQDRKEEAEAEYRAAIQADPNDAMAHFHLGVLFEDLGRKAEAEVEYRAAIQANPKYAPGHFNLGNLRAGLDRKEEAEAEYRAAIQADPNHAKAYYNLGLLLLEAGKPKEALPLAVKSHEQEPDFLSCLALASIHAELGDVQNSQHYLLEARKIVRPDDLYHLACLDVLSGNLESAFECLRRAIEEKKVSAEWAWRAPYLAALRRDPRFEAIVGPRPG